MGRAGNPKKLVSNLFQSSVIEKLVQVQTDDFATKVSAAWGHHFRLPADLKIELEALFEYDLGCSNGSESRCEVEVEGRLLEDMAATDPMSDQQTNPHRFGTPGWG
jgi:hypothetical protein